MLTGSLPTSVMAEHTRAGAVAFDMDLAVIHDTRLDAVVSFDSIAAFFTVQLLVRSLTLETGRGFSQHA
jgi:hypothetical protein